MNDVVVTPPAASEWDLHQLVERAMEVLRLGSTDVDAARIHDAATAATEVIDAFLDRPEPLPVSRNMLARAVQVTVEEYQRPGVAWGVVNAWSADSVSFRISGDPLAGVIAGLLPDKRRWGVG